ncbi:glycosyltransferase family 1 protein [Thomasclavelia sp.]|uniref:glycosyltransferase family 1 protein n=1 Tax=Thomasclavelia sp. TaxID=3025757 RepID=UPI0025E96E10|nr:glycosyltransferase family 1 protein [Thomasclavelia sp.]
MIRVLHVVTYMGRGGLETMLMNYYRNIDHTKVQFDFLVHRDFEADYDKEILNLGGKIYHISRLNPFGFKYHKELNDFFKNHKEYKIVHVHQDCMSSLALKAAKKNRVPIRIAHSHNANQAKDIKYLIKKFYMKKTPKYATSLFACGEDAGDWMFDGHKYIILNNAIDTKKFAFDKEKRSKIKKKFNLDNDELIIGNIARFHRQKNHQFLLDVFKEILKIKNDVKLLLVGGGKDFNSIVEKAKLLNINKNIIFTGVRDNVNELMQAMDIFVFPSIYEGLPVTLIEAQANGLPIVKSNNVPDQCIITDNVYSMSLDQSPHEWAKKILDIASNFKRKDTSQQIIDNGYDIRTNAKWLEKFYLDEVNKIGK